MRPETLSRSPRVDQRSQLRRSTSTPSTRDVTPGPPTPLSHCLVQKRALSPVVAGRADRVVLREPEPPRCAALPTEPVTLQERQHVETVVDLKTPEGVTTKFPPRRPVKARRKRERGSTGGSEALAARHAERQGDV